MAREVVPFLAFNRGLISPKSLARVDLERSRLSAETFENFIPKMQGAMTIRPGSKYFGSSIRDTGAQFIEFVASTDDVALLELTNDTGTGEGTMRIWMGTDAHEISLLGRPAVNTTVTLSDTGWADTSIGGAVASGSGSDVIPNMTGATTGNVQINASSDNNRSANNDGGRAWHAADGSTATVWQDTGEGSALPSWWNVDFDATDSADTGLRVAVTSYSIRAADQSSFLDNQPQAWRLITANFDTGTYATDTGKWTVEDSQTAQTGWALSEKRTFSVPGGDTGTVEARRHWRLYVTQAGGSYLYIAEIEFFTLAAARQAYMSGGSLYLNATSIGALARREKRVIISDTGTEHALAINVARGPVVLRVGSTQRDDDYVAEASLSTGYHNIAFTPQNNFWITLQHDGLADRIVGSLAISDTGTVEIRTPWSSAHLDDIRSDQSADVIYVDCDGVRPQKIERRGTGRSWSVVDYAPDDGPFLDFASSSAQLSVSYKYGNTTLNSDIPFFTADHDGALVRIFHEGQGGQWPLGALDAVTDTIAVTGIADTGTTPNYDTGYSDRNITVDVSGTYDGEITIEKSIEGTESGFKPVGINMIESGASYKDTGTFFRKIVDRDDNTTAYYRCRRSDTGTGSGVAIVKMQYAYGGVTGIGRITSYSSNTSCGFEVLSRFSDTGPSDSWQQGYWSAARGYPTAVALHGGRLGHARGGSLFLSVSDDYESFDSSVEGDAGPIIKTLGSGPVDSIHYLVSLLRLIVGTAGAEITVRSSSLDEPLTPDNSSAVPFSTQGSANVRAIKLDTRAIMVQRSKQRVFMIGPAQNALSDYESFELTLLVPDLLAAGVISIAVQRQPDTRLHCVLGDGTVAILTYEPQEEVICWSLYTTQGYVERAAALPGVQEDAVFYHVRRTINGHTKRFLEKWAKESECLGDTGLHWLADCAASVTDTGRTASLTAAVPHLPNTACIVWGDLDSGSYPFTDFSPGYDAAQTTYTTNDSGDITLSLTQGVHHAVAGLPYTADWRSTKLAYAAQQGTALTQMKRAGQLGYALYKTHRNGLRFGDDTGDLEPLGKIIHGKNYDPDYIFESIDHVPKPSRGRHSEDPRIHLRAQAPRPCTVLAVVPAVETAEK